jgi:hypothetical protein
MTQILYELFAWNLCGLYIYTFVHPLSRADELVGSHEQLATVIVLNESDGLKMLYEQLSDGYELHSLVFFYLNLLSVEIFLQSCRYGSD